MATLNDILDQGTTYTFAPREGILKKFKRNKLLINIFSVVSGVLVGLLCGANFIINPNENTMEKMGMGYVIALGIMCGILIGVIIGLASYCMTRALFLYPNKAVIKGLEQLKAGMSAKLNIRNPKFDGESFLIFLLGEYDTFTFEDENETTYMFKRLPDEEKFTFCVLRIDGEDGIIQNNRVYASTATYVALKEKEIYPEVKLLPTFDVLVSKMSLLDNESFTEVLEEIANSLNQVGSLNLDEVSKARVERVNNELGELIALYTTSGVKAKARIDELMLSNFVMLRDELLSVEETVEDELVENLESRLNWNKELFVLEDNRTPVEL